MGAQTNNLQEVMRIAKERFALDLHGCHGVSHWQRVRENGLRLAKKTKADRLVVELFALLHDCCRESDNHDPDHGPRAATFIESLRDNVFELEDERFECLQIAIREHTRTLFSRDATIATCFDSDRLDIGRVGAKPNPGYLNTDAAKEKATINWAYKRSREGR